MNKEIKVSIIVPVYNVEKYLKQCLNSLVNQTIDNYEIIVVNDGSTDDSQKIIDQYKKDYPKIIKSYIKENGGLSDARNYGIEKASGKYIGFVDSDDYVDIHMYEELYNKARDTKADVVAMPFNWLYTRTIKKFFFSEVCMFGQSVTNNPDIMEVVSSYAWNKIYNLKMWKKNKFKFPKGQVFEDSYLIYNVLLMANKIECVNNPMYYYRQNNQSSITKVFDSKVSHIFLSCNSIIDFYKQNSDYNKLYEYVRNTCIRHIMPRIKLAIKTRGKKAKKFVKEAYKYLDSHFPDWRKDRYFDPIVSRTKVTRSIVKYKFITKLYINTPKFIEVNVRKSLKWSKKTIRGIAKKVVKKHNTINISQKTADNRKKSIAKNGYKAICQVQELLDKMEIINFVDFGTLLGFVREGKFMEHDIDIDIGVITDIDPHYICSKLEDIGFKLWREYLLDDLIVEHSYMYKGIKIDLNFYSIENNKMCTYLFYTKPKSKLPVYLRNVVKMTYSSVNKTKKEIFEGHKINIPINAKKLIQEKYGKDWKVPNTNWIYWKSPAAKPIEEVGHFITFKYAEQLYHYNSNNRD